MMMKKGPVDEGWSWVVLAAVFGVLIFAGSTIYGTGVIHVFLLETFGEDPVKTSWVGALSSSLCSLLGPVGGILASRTSCKLAVCVGGFICMVGFTASAFVTDFNLLFFTYGVLVGGGTGIAHTPAVVVLGYYFDKKRDLACGLAIAGCGVGMMAGPMTIQWLTDLYGWRGMFLLLGGLSFHICVFGFLLFPSSIELEQKRIRKNLQVDVKSGFKTHFRIFTNKAFLLLCLSIFLFNFSTSSIFLHFPSYCMRKGSTPVEVTYLLTVTSISSIVARVLSGLGTNHGPWIKYLYYFGPYGVVSIVVFVFPMFSDTSLGRYVFSALFGLYTTVAYVVMNPITVELVGLFDLALAFGIEMLVCGLGFLIGPPVAALVVQQVGDYSATLYLTGSVMMLSSVLGMLIMLVRKPLNVVTEESEISNLKKIAGKDATPAELLCSMTSLPGIFGTPTDNLNLSVLSLTRRYPSLMTSCDEHASRPLLVEESDTNCAAEIH